MKHQDRLLPMIFALLLLLAVPSPGAVSLSAPRSADEVPPAFKALWQAGDWIVTSPHFTALVAGPARKPEWRQEFATPFLSAAGSIVAFLPAGMDAADEVNIGQPLVRVGTTSWIPAYRSGAPQPAAGEGEVSLKFQAEAAGPNGEKAVIVTVYRFLPDDGGVRVASTITNAGPAAIKELNFSLHVFSGTRYSFSPFQRELLPRLNYRMHHKKGQSLAWVELTPPAKTEGPAPGQLDPGQSFTLECRLLSDRSGEALLKKVFDLLTIPSYPARLQIMAQKGRLVEWLVKDYLTSTVLYRDFIKDMPVLTLPLPRGAYSVTANAFPAVVESRLAVSEGGENICSVTDPARGTVKVKIRDGEGNPLPGKVSFIGLDPTRTPYFEPENPRQTQRGWETMNNSCNPPAEGQTVALGAGVYLATASLGPEWSTDQKVVEILEDSQEEILFRLDRAVQTDDLLSLDPHLHTKFSDGRMTEAERLRSVAAEGVEAVVATDHNLLTDYAPALRATGLEAHVAAGRGIEITPFPQNIHFNAFPLALPPGAEVPGPLPFGGEETAPYFLAARGQFPSALLQVNHPRAGTLGFFNNMALDAEKAAWISDRASLDFDLYEALNGPFFHGSNAAAVEDWLHLLNRGIFRPLTGSSDSHDTDHGEPGYCRTYVLLPGAEGGKWTWASMAEALKKGRSFASNGPLLELGVNGRATFGETVRAPSGRVDIFMEVRSADWVAVDEVRLIINGERRLLFPVRAPASNPVKFSQRLSLELKEDSYLVLEALGRRTLFPVVQQPAENGQWKSAALPYALSNPVFVDMDGDGRFTPPWPEAIEFRKNLAPLAEPVPRR